MNFRISFAAVILLAITPLGFCGADTANADGEYRLSAGDRVLVTVFGHDDLSGQFDISPEDVISMPLIPGSAGAWRSPPISPMATICARWFASFRERGNLSGARTASP